MPGNRGVSNWHKKIHGKSKNAPSSLKIGSDELTAAPEDSSDWRRYHGWRPTLQGSRPATPVSVVPITPVTEDRSDRSETDARSNQSEAATPHSHSRPKASRYTSVFNNIKEASREPDFPEPWNDDTTPSYQPVIDTMSALQSVYSHTLRYPSKPIPHEYHSGLFRVFEDYRKSKNENEQLKSILEDTCRNWETAEKHWANSERQLQADVRRLEALMTRGASSTAGGMSDKRKNALGIQRRHRKTISTDRLPSTVDAFSREHIGEQPRLTVQQGMISEQIRCQLKPLSGNMAALSQQFIGTGLTHLTVGAPPSITRRMMLSRKVQSELNITTTGQIDELQPVLGSMNSRLSNTRNALPEKALMCETRLMESVNECDVFIELRELGKLVALRRGLKTDDFVDGLMKLFLDTGVEEHNQGSREHSNEERQLQSTPPKDDEVHQKLRVEKGITSNPTLRRFQSQPQLSSDQKRRRHFSFEPGDDHLQALEENFILDDANQDISNSSGSDSQTSVSSQIPTRRSQPGESNHSLQPMNLELQKLSKIPSPVQTIGRVRQKNSDSSLQSVFTRSNQDLRRDSRSSILTAFRESPSGQLKPTKSRHTLVHNPSTSEFLLAPKDQENEIQTRNSIVLKAAKDHVDQQSAYGASSPTKSDSQPMEVVLSARVPRSTGLLQSENNQPHKRL